MYVRHNSMFKTLTHTLMRINCGQDMERSEISCVLSLNRDSVGGCAAQRQTGNGLVIGFATDPCSDNQRPERREFLLRNAFPIILLSGVTEWVLV